MSEIGSTRKSIATAALLDGLGWENDKSQVPIAPGITLMCPRGSCVEGLYGRLCERTGIDDGDPYLYRKLPMGQFRNRISVDLGLPAGYRGSLMRRRVREA